jgi:hypothetical protein
LRGGGDADSSEVDRACNAHEQEERLMSRKRTLLVFIPLVLGLTAGALALALPGSADDDGRDSGEILEESALLTGLAPNSVFPFIDSTPNTIRRAHVAITDSTTSCGGAAPTAPRNMEVLVGEAGVALVPVMGASTNTGIGNAGQCVFHVTVRAGRGGIPARITDIVVVNKSATALSGINTVTASAEVR